MQSTLLIKTGIEYWIKKDEIFFRFNFNNHTNGYIVKQNIITNLTNSELRFIN